MYCFVCGKIFYIRRTLKTLFKDEVEFICQRCKKKYKPLLLTQIIPKTKGVFEITSFFKEDNDIKIEIFYKEIINWLKNSSKDQSRDNYLIWVDQLNINLINILDEVKGNIYILTNKIFNI